MKPMTVLLAMFVGLMAGVALGLGIARGAGWLKQLRPTAPPPAPTDSHAAGLTLERVRELSELTTLKVQVADALETQIQGRTGSIKAVLVVRGELTVGVDLSAAKFETIDEKNHTAVLLLPQPVVTSTALDQERTRLLGVWESGLWTIVPGGEEADAAAVNRAYRDAERDVAKAGEDSGVLQQARDRSERALDMFAQRMGWSLKVHWSGQ